MSDMEVAPDPIIRTALQRLPIPAHADDFWTRLSAQIDLDAAPAPNGRKVLVDAPDLPSRDEGADAVPSARAAEPDPALALVPKALRKTSNGVLLAVAAAAAVVVGLAGTALLDDRTGTESIASETTTPKSRTSWLAWRRVAVSMRLMAIEPSSPKSWPATAARSAAGTKAAIAELMRPTRSSSGSASNPVAESPSRPSASAAGPAPEAAWLSRRVRSLVAC